MPEFILDKGDTNGAAWFDGLDAFTQGYVEAMFFTSTGTGDDEDLEDATVSDLSEEAREAIYQTCAIFQRDNRADLDEALDTGRINGYDEAGAGRDYWYSRNGHGVGFFDRGLGDIGDKLQKSCRRFYSPVDLYRHKDRLYLS